MNSRLLNEVSEIRKMMGLIGESKDNRLTQDIPQYFYHATYKPLLPSIKETGLSTGESMISWEDSEPGVVYLANDPYVAESYAETSEMVDDEWLDEIIILKIASKDLDLSKLYDDRNVRGDFPSDTFEYHGIIPWDVITLKTPSIGENDFGDRLDLKKISTDSDYVTGRYKVGDEVILRGNSTVTDVLKVVGIGKWSEDFLMTYIVEFPNGELAQYDETELSLNPGFTL